MRMQGSIQIEASEKNQTDVTTSMKKLKKKSTRKDRDTGEQKMYRGGEGKPLIKLPYGTALLICTS